jgi:hypothetical protein
MSSGAWREPSRSLRLHWGTYTGRYLAGLLLIIAGGIQLQGSNTYTLPLLLIGTTAHVVGWSILPARGWRRLIVVLPATTQIWLLLTGPDSAWTFCVPFLAWLIVRHRPLICYVTVLLPLASGFIVARLFREYSGMPATLAISLAIVVLAAWIARLFAQYAPLLIAKSRATPSNSTPRTR